MARCCYRAGPWTPELDLKLHVRVTGEPCVPFSRHIALRRTPAFSAFEFPRFQELPTFLALSLCDCALRRLSSALSGIQKVRQSDSRVPERGRNVGLTTGAGRLTNGWRNLGNRAMYRWLCRLNTCSVGKVLSYTARCPEQPMQNGLACQPQLCYWLPDCVALLLSQLKHRSTPARDVAHSFCYGAHLSVSQSQHHQRARALYSRSIKTPPELTRFR
jgi:hypothetical protein